MAPHPRESRPPRRSPAPHRSAPSPQHQRARGDELRGGKTPRLTRPHAAYAPTAGASRLYSNAPLEAGRVGQRERRAGTCRGGRRSRAAPPAPPECRYAPTRRAPCSLDPHAAAQARGKHYAQLMAWRTRAHDAATSRSTSAADCTRDVCALFVLAVAEDDANLPWKNTAALDRASSGAPPRFDFLFRPRSRLVLLSPARFCRRSRSFAPHATVRRRTASLQSPVRRARRAAVDFRRSGKGARLGPLPLTATLHKAALAMPDPSHRS